MNKTSIIVPTDSLPFIIKMLTDEVATVTDNLNKKVEQYNNAQYRISELSNQVDALKEENKRLYGMYQNKEDF